MKVFFIIPPEIYCIEPYAYQQVSKNNITRPYLGLLYVAAMLKKITHIEAEIIHAPLNHLTLENIKNIILVEKPDIIGFSVLTFNLLNCLTVSQSIKSYCPQTKICFGGWHPTLYPKQTLQFDSVDYIVIGEGEYTFVELVETLQLKKTTEDLSKIHGLGYKIQNQIKINPARSLITNLDVLPFPYQNFNELKKHSNILAYSDNFANISTARGCPYGCIFCDVRRTQYRTRSIANILEEIEYLNKKGIREFYIQDDNFTINTENAIQFCEQLVKKRLNIKYKISARIDHINDELLSQLKRSGCYRIHLGVESGSQRILDYLEKGITIAQIKNAFRLAHKHHMVTFAYIMIGVPTETQEEIKKTLQLVNEIKPEYLHCSICTPMPKTLLYQRLLKEGEIADDYWEKFAQHPDSNFITPVINDNHNRQELKIIQNKIHRRFYFHPSSLFREIINTRGLKQFLLKIKLATGILTNIE